jgi:alpha-galactosidase
MDVKITLIGAGSAVFSLNLIRDFCLTPNLQGACLTFMDIDPVRLENVYNLCQRYASEVGIHLRLEMTTDRRAALQNADFVINTALAAGHDRLREGWGIGRKHGYRMGGSLHIMHDEAFWINYFQYQLFEEIIQDMLEISPQAWYLQVANPVFAGITMLCRKYPQARIAGLCHGFSGVYHLAEVLGLRRDQLTFEIPGVNHFVWLTKLLHEGKDVLPLIDRWIHDEAPAYWATRDASDDLGPKPVDLYRRYGVFPIGDTATPGGGAWPWWYHVDGDTEQHWREDPEGWYERYFSWTRKTVSDIHQAARDEKMKVTDLFPPQKSGEVMVDMIESIACDLPRILTGNVLNTGCFVPGLPGNISVEIPTLVSARGIEGVRTNPLPPAVLARIHRDRIAPVEVELAAYTHGSRDLLLELVMMDPWTRTLQQANVLLEEILNLPYHTEMKDHYR